MKWNEAGLNVIRKNNKEYIYKKYENRNGSERCLKCGRFISSHKSFFNCKAKIESDLSIINDIIIDDYDIQQKLHKKILKINYK